MADDPKKPIPLDRDKRLLEKIEQLIANPPEGSVVLEITPGIARHLIDVYNTHNRTAKPGAIKRYHQDMELGAWWLNGENLKFTNKGRLGDGQNRLLACLRADKPFKSHVVFGIPDEYFFSIDQGRVRGPTDVLYLEGVTDANVAQAVRWAELIASNSVKRRHTFAANEIRSLWRNKHKGVADFIDEAKRIRVRNKQPVPLVAAVLYHCDKVDSAFAGEFSFAWEAGTYEPRFRPIGTMQGELVKLSNTGSGRIHDVVRAAMIINAWNAAHTGSGRIRWTIDLPFPTIK